MTGPHSPWQLFCNDLDQAQQWVIDELTSRPTDKQLGHQALSLGLTKTVRQLLDHDNLDLEDETRRQWKFRLARLNGANNPYAELIPPEVQTFTDLQMDFARRRSLPVVVSVLGGIGDHLELISMLKEWNQIDEQKLILQVTPQRQKELSPLIEAVPQFELQSSIHPRAVQGMAIREWICRHHGAFRYSTWIPNTVNKNESTQGTLHCWKAKGEENRLSAYLRSVPFMSVLSYYKNVQKINPGLTLVDISDWKTEEIIMLKELGVHYLNPRDTGLEGLVHKFRCKHIITIDTALAHLCAAMGAEATLLLNQFPDERWTELYKPENCYRKHLSILQQTQFCDWDYVMSSLLAFTST